MNISSSPQRTCPSEERPQTCYCSDYISIKHLLIAREREKRGKVRVVHGQTDGMDRKQEKSGQSKKGNYR